MASNALAFAAGRVDGKPFSVMAAIVDPRVLVPASVYFARLQTCLPAQLQHTSEFYAYLVQPCTPEYFKKAQYAFKPSCCAATFESATAPFHSPGSCRNGRNTGSDSSGDTSNCFVASSYPPFLTFQFYVSMFIHMSIPITSQLPGGWGNIKNKKWRKIAGLTLWTNLSGRGKELKSSSCSAILRGCKRDALRQTDMPNYFIYLAPT